MSLSCPAGHGPFPDWADRCPECDAVLVGREPMVYLATAPSEPVAQLWRQQLQGAGVRAMVRDLGPGIGAFGTASHLEHAVHVLAPNLDRARRVIARPSGTTGRGQQPRSLAGQDQPRSPWSPWRVVLVVVVIAGLLGSLLVPIVA